jgi:hypothetical protein
VETNIYEDVKLVEKLSDSLGSFMLVVRTGCEWERLDVEIRSGYIQ